MQSQASHFLTYWGACKTPTAFRVGIQGVEGHVISTPFLFIVIYSHLGCPA